MDGEATLAGSGSLVARAVVVLMTVYEDWLPEVLPMVPECPDVLAINAIRNACIEFCTVTNWWQEDYGEVTLATANLPYTFSVPAGVSAAQVMVVTLNGRPLSITNIDELDSKVIGWRTATGEPRAVFQPSPGVVDFYPRPAGDESYSIFFRLSFTPLRSSTEIDSDVFEAYLEEIAAGALARLMAIPGKPWTNIEGATSYGSAFNSAKVQAAIEATKSYGRGSTQIQMRKV